MSAEPVLFTPNKSDKEQAEDLRHALKAALGIVIEVMNDAEARGLRAGFQLGRDGLGRMFIQTLEINKPL